MTHTDWLVMEPPAGAPDAPFRARLAGAGRHLPTTRLATDELMSTTRHRTHIDLERLTGIRERRVSVGDEDSYSLATAAAMDCLDKAQVDAASLAVQLGVPPERITMADDERMHTASLASAFNDAATAVGAPGLILIVAAGAGVTAGAALYRL